MRVSRLFVALLVLIVVIAFFYFYEIKGKRDQQREARLEQLLYTYDANDIASLEILSGREHIKLEKRGTEWFIIQPVTYPADPQNVEQIISALKEAKITSFVDKPGDLHEYNLSPAFITVSLTTSSREKLPSLWVGDETPLRGEFFAMQEGNDAVLVISMHIAKLLTASLYDLRDKRLLPFSRWDISEFIVKQAENTMHCKNEEGFWNIIEPFEFPADENKIATLLNALEVAEAKQFLDDVSFPRSDLGLDERSLTLSCRRQNDKEGFTVFLGMEKEDLLYAKRSDRDSVLLIEKSLFSVASSDPKDFMDTRISKRNRYNVKSFVITWDGKSKEASKNSEDAWVSQDSGMRLDGADIYLLLASIMETRSSDFSRWEENKELQYGLTKPVVKIAVKGDDFAEEIRFSEAPSGHWYAINSSTKTVIYRITPDDIQKIMKNLSDIFR